MSVEEIKALAHRLIVAMDNGDWAAVDDCYAPEFTYQNPSLPTIRTREDLRQLFVAMRTAFPPGHWTEDETLVVGDTGVSILTFSGVHRATYRGVPPTGKEVAMQAIAVSRIEGRRIVETRALTDILGLLVTIGALPVPVQPAKPTQKQVAMWVSRPHPTRAHAHTLASAAKSPSGSKREGGRLSLHARAGGTLGGLRILGRASFAEMIRNQIPGICARFGDELFPEAFWSLTWNGKCARKSLRSSSLSSDRAASHGGYGGSLLWVDPAYDLVGVYFSVSPAVYPSGTHVWNAGLFTNAAIAAFDE